MLLFTPYLARLAHWRRGDAAQNRSAACAVLALAGLLSAPQPADAHLLAGALYRSPITHIDIAVRGGGEYPPGVVPPAATVFYVRDGSDDGGYSLREGVSELPSGGTLYLDGNTVTLTSGPIVLSKPIYIEGPGTVTSASGNTNLFQIATNTSQYSTQFDNVNLVGGADTASDASAQAAIVSGPAIFNNCAFSGSSSASLYVPEGYGVDLNNCSITGDTVSNAISGTVAPLVNYGAMSLQSCTISGNQSYGSDVATLGVGAIFSDGDAALSQCTITGNSDATFGFGYGSGALYNGGSLQLASSLIAGNHAANFDAASLLSLTETTTSLVGCTLSGNTSDSGADDIETYDTLALDSDIVYDGTFSDEQGLGTGVAAYADSTYEYCDIEGLAATPSAPDANHNFGADPLFLGASSTTTPYALGVGSPCLGIADPELINVSDLTGFPIVELPCIGAYDSLPTSTTLALDSSSPAASSYGTPVTVDATVSIPPNVSEYVSATCPSDGTLSFYSNGQLVDSGVKLTAVLSQSATVASTSYTYNDLAAGNDTLTAVYVPSNYTHLTSQTASPVVETVQIPTTTTLSSNLNPAQSGQMVTLTASVTIAGSGVSVNGGAGTVSFFLNGSSTPFDTEPVYATGDAVSQTAALPVGSNQITATFKPDPSTTYTSSASNALKQTVNPTPPAGNLRALTLAASSQQGPATVTGNRVYVHGNAPASEVVTLTSSDPSAVVVPASVIVNKGSSSRTFNLSVSKTAPNETVTITASYNGQTQTAQIAVSPAPVNSSSMLKSVVANPSSMEGGATSMTSRVYWTGAAPATEVVSLSSSDPAVASVPKSVTVQQGYSSHVFTITTQPVTSQQTVTITAMSSDGVIQTTTLTVIP